ncbi:YlxR family protein [Microlunatus sp. Y2014]|uniref:YlxR family protein n=1 Tax=Microlunatus sp. Y2014 TaxID=3418488 RepID=UPI003DA76691
MAEPVRTCVGCRRRAERSELIRMVYEPVACAVVVDVRKVLPGRGAHLHPSERCLTEALRRRAIGRALRRTGSDGNPVVDPEQVWRVWRTAVPAGSDSAADRA